MARPLRITYPGAVYHVMNRGVSRKRVFSHSTDYERFLQLLQDCHGRWGVEILAYCLMGNHYHLCLRTPEGNLARVMRHVNGVYTQHINRMQGRDGPLFRGRYKALVVETDTYLPAVIRYIHLNPLKAKLVQTPEAYRWSSHARYLRSRGAPPWLAVQEVLAGFGKARDFHEFVLAGNDAALEAFYAVERQAPVLGSEAFRANLQRNLGRLCDWTLQATADYFGLTSYGGASWAGAQIRVKREAEKSFRNKLNRLENQILQQQT